jgi:2-C-methyl-D-erythritol 4-phosphate cytidylyltransferase
VGEIIVALPPDHLDAAPPGTRAVAGGELRSQSVIAALAVAAGSEDPVIVHDAARPLVRAELFVGAVAALRREAADAVVCAAPVTDTIKQVAPRSHRVLATLDRERLWTVQTPQVFRRSVLDEVLAGASEDQLRTATDEAMLVEQSGGTVVILPAPNENFKVTSAVDLRVAELLLSERAA